MGMDYALLCITKSDNEFLLCYGICKDAVGGQSEKVEKSLPVQGSQIWMKVAVHEGGLCQFAYSENGTDFNDIGTPFQAVEGRWIGTKMGIFTHKNTETGPGGWADFDWFRIGPE